MGPEGLAGANGPHGPAGPNGPDRKGGVDRAGYYLAIATGTVTNTGAADDYLNCGFDVSGTLAGAAGFSTTAGNASAGTS